MTSNDRPDRGADAARPIFVSPTEPPPAPGTTPPPATVAAGTPSAPAAMPTWALPRHARSDAERLDPRRTNRLDHVRTRRRLDPRRDAFGRRAQRRDRHGPRRGRPQRHARCRRHASRRSRSSSPGAAGVVQSLGAAKTTSATTVQSLDLTEVIAAGPEVGRDDHRRRRLGRAASRRSASRPPASAPASIITADGYILTNRHVVEGAQTLSVELAGRHDLRRAADRAGRPTTDLALIKVDATGLTAAKIGDSAAIQVGQTAIAIGSPLGTYTETVTRGHRVRPRPRRSRSRTSRPAARPRSTA